MRKKYVLLVTLFSIILLSLTACSSGSANSSMLSADVGTQAENTSPPLSSMNSVVFAATNDGGFRDVPSDAWYSEAVDYCYQNGLMSGTSSTTFAPETELSRAMVVTILHRAAGIPAVSGASAFSDVESAAWYSDAVTWAAQSNIVNGYGNGLFGTNDPITREQLVTILWNYDGKNTAEATSLYMDMSSVSSWAADAVAWSNKYEIANIKDGNRFDPKSNATRAEAAYMLMKLLLLSSESSISSASESPLVYMTTDISPESMTAIYNALNATVSGKVAVKLSTGEPPASNYLRPELIKDLVQSLNGTIVECNTAYGGSRASNAMHLQVAKDHGFTDIAEFDLMDSDGSVSLPVVGGEVLSENFVGSHFSNYDYFVVLSHFKGHAMAGYGGAIKNISIGIASSSGKSWIHTGGTSKSGFMGDQSKFLMSMAEAGKSVVDSLDGNILYINVMNRLSVDCDCDGNPAEPDMHDIGILASFDPVALDQACIDLVAAAPDGSSFMERINSRNGILTIEHAEKIGLGNREYNLQSIDK